MICPDCKALGVKSEVTFIATLGHLGVAAIYFPPRWDGDDRPIPEPEPPIRKNQYSCSRGHKFVL